MSPKSLTALLVGSVLAAGLIASSTGVVAQVGRSAGVRVGSVDIGMVFQEYQRKKDLDEEMKQAEDTVQLEIQTRQQAIDSFQNVLDSMSPDDPTYVDKQRQMLKMQIEFKNWFDLKQADMTREVGLWTTRIYREINEKVEEIAKRDGYEIVLYHDEFRPRGLDPKVIQEQIANRRVLYVSPNVDLSGPVLEVLNASYRAQPRSKMLGI